MNVLTLEIVDHALFPGAVSPDGQRLIIGGWRGQGATTIDIFE